MRPICSHYLCYCYVENYEISLLNKPLPRDKTNRTHCICRYTSCLIISCISVVKVVGGCILAKESWMKIRFYTMDFTWYCSGICWSICTLVFFWNIKNLYPFVWFVCLPSKVQEPRSSTVEFWNHIFNQLKTLCNVVFHAYWIKLLEFACSHPPPS